jgi:hypothetical protein
MAGAAVYGFAAVGTMAGTDELNAGAVTAIAAGFTAFLTVVHGIFVYIILRTLAGVIAGVAPFIHRVEAGTAVAAAVFTTLQFQIENVGVGFRTVAVMTFCVAIIGHGATADTDAALIIISHDGRFGRLLGFHRIGLGRLCGIRLGRRIRFGRLCVIFFCAGLLRC